jgi:hypothetical protein
MLKKKYKIKYNLKHYYIYYISYIFNIFNNNFIFNNNLFIKLYNILILNKKAIK